MSGLSKATMSAVTVLSQVIAAWDEVAAAMDATHTPATASTCLRRRNRNIPGLDPLRNRSLGICFITTSFLRCTRGIAQNPDSLKGFRAQASLCRNRATPKMGAKLGSKGLRYFDFF
jgi:hypothetical protein